MTTQKPHFFCRVGAILVAALAIVAFLPGAQAQMYYCWSDFVGSPRISGTADGTGTAARFNYPGRIALDAAGNLYVADSTNCTIRKVTPAGAVTTLAGRAGVYGSLDGTGSGARFNNPYGIATDTAGNVYVADTSNNTIRKVTPAGVVTTVAGSILSGSTDGVGSAARFCTPFGIAVSGTNIYVADEGNHTIRKVGLAGTVTTLAGSPGISGSADGVGSAARFSNPGDLAVDAAGNLYVADEGNQTIRKVTPAGVVSTLAGSPGTTGSADGTGSAARFNYPNSVTLDATGNVYVSDAYNHTVRKVTPAGMVSTLGGLAGITGTAGGIGTAARFDRPRGIALTATWILYVSDSINNRIAIGMPFGAVTGSASVLSNTVAVVSGSANPNGLSSVVWFEYGLTTGYTSGTIACQAIGSGSAFLPASGTLTGLAAGTTYHYRLGLSNSNGVLYGEDGTFAAGPWYAVNDMTVTGSNVTLSASVNPNGFAGPENDPANVHVYWQFGSVSGSYNQPTFVVQPIGTGTSAVPVTLTLPFSFWCVPGIYHYQLVISSTLGNTYGPDQIFAYERPTASYNPPVVTLSNAVLSATVTPNGPDTTAYIQYGWTTEYLGSTVPQNIGNGITPVVVNGTIAGLPPVTTFHYRVVATNVLGTIYGADQVFTTGPQCTINEATVTATSVTLSSVVLPNGLAGPAGDPANLEVFWQYGLVSGSYTQATAVQPVGTGTSVVPVNFVFSNSALSPAIYHYRLVVSSTLGYSYGPDQIFSVEAPASVYNPPIVTFSSAILSPAVTPNGLDTTAYIQYGLTTAYTSGATTPRDIGNGLSPIVVSGTFTDLATATTYHYRVVATNVIGTVYGADQVFATGPGYTVNGATVTGTTVTLSGTVNPNGFAGPATDPANVDVFWQYGFVSGGYSYSTAVQSIGTGTSALPVNTVLANSVLTPAIYHYRLVVSSTLGNTCGPDQIFSVEPPTFAYNPPVVTFSSAILSATVNPSGLDTTAYIQYGRTTAYTGDSTPFQHIGSGLSPVVVNGTFNGMATGTTYHYRVVVTNVIGTVYGADQLFATGPQYTVNDATVTGTSVTLSAAVNANGIAGPAGDPANVEVSWQYGLVSGSYTQSTAVQSIGNGTSALPVNTVLANSALTAAMYHYRLVVSSTLGNTYGPDQIFSVEAPVAACNPPVVTFSNAILSPTVTPNDLDTTAYIQYGLTTAYTGGATLPQDIGNGLAPVVVNGTFTGLAPATTYHYRVVATNVIGTVYGADQVFETGPEYTANDATVTGSSVTLSGVVNPNGFAGPVGGPANVEVFWQYGLVTGSYTQATAVQPVGTGTSAVPVNLVFANSALTPAIYHYRIVVSSTLGNTYGPDQLFSVEAPVSVCNPPVVTLSDASLSLTVNPNGLDTTVFIQYGLTTDYTSGATLSQDIGNGFSPVVVNGTLAGLEAATTYHYRIVATNVLGTVYGTDQVFGTGPEYVVNDATVSGTSVTLSGVVNPNGFAGPVGDPANVEIFWQYGLVSGSDMQSTAVQSIGTGTSALPVNVVLANSALTPAVYYYRLVVSSTLGNNYGPDQIFSVEAPVPVYNPPVVSLSDANLSLTVNPNGLDTTAYIQYGLTTAYTSGTTTPQNIGNGLSPVVVNGTLAGLALATIYHYRVVATNVIGTVYGADQVFATGPGYTANDATVTVSSVTLSGTVNPNGFAGPSGDPANVEVFWQYGLVAGSYTQSTAVQSTGTGTSALPVTLTLPSSEFGQAVYHYRLVVSSTLGNTCGPDQVFSFEAPSPGYNPPVVTFSNASLSSAVNPNGLDTTAFIQYGLTTAYTSGATLPQDIGNGLSPVAVNGTFAGLAPAVTYHYRVVATNLMGTVYGADQVFETGPGYTADDATVTVTSVTFSGVVNPNGFAGPDGDPANVEAFWQYGLVSGSYTQATEVLPVGTGTSAVPVSLVLANSALAPAIYHYRLVVSSTLGNTYGPDRRFTVEPPTVATVTGSNFTLSTSLIPSGFAGSVTNPPSMSVYWRYGLVSGSYPLVTAAQAVGAATWPVSVTFTQFKGRLSASVYHYQIVISSTQGIIYGLDRTFSFEQPTVAINAPSVTLAGATAQASIDPNAVDTTVTFQWGMARGSYTSGTTPAQDIGGGLAPVTVSGTFTGLVPNTLYHYRVVTTNALGTVYGPDQTLATQALYGTAAVLASKATAPGIPGAIFSMLGNPALNDSDHTAFQAMVTGSVGSGVIASGTGANNTGIWAESGTNGRMLMVRAGMTAPGYCGSGTTVGTFATLSDPVYAGDDTIAFLGTLVKTGTVTVANNIGIWASTSGSLALVARIGDPASDASGSTSASSPVFAKLTQFALPEQGGIIVVATLQTGVGGATAANSQGIWAMDATGVLKRIIGTGDALTISGSARTVFSLTIFNAPATATGQTRHFNPLGDVICKAGFANGSSGVLRLEPTASGRYAATAVVLTKDPAPGIPGAIFSVLGNPIVTDSNHTAFQATVTGSATAGIIASGSAANNSGIWADSGTHGRMLIVRTGTTAPGYAGSGPAVGTFATLSDPVYADDDAVAFLGTLVKTGGVTVANNTGVWATASGSLALVARTGDPAPDASGSTSASSPVFAVFSQFVLPSRGGVIVFATLKTGVAGVVAANSQGIWAVDASGVLKQIIRTGAALTVNGSAKIVSSLMVFNAPAYPAGQTRHFNNSGDLIYKVIFSDSSSGVVQSVFP